MASKNLQEFHGESFAKRSLVDFSTTIDSHLPNLLEVAPSFLKYPEREHDDFLRRASSFLYGSEHLWSRMTVGCGDSELIDILSRLAPNGNFFLHSDPQYREYERILRLSGRQPSRSVSEAKVIVIVNPNNPTGVFFSNKDLERWIDMHVTGQTWVIVDESMLMWNPDMQSSGVSQEFIERMHRKGVDIFVIYSWTKFFACPGARVSTVLCPNILLKNNVQALRNPWGVCDTAIDYLMHCLDEPTYHSEIRETTSSWRRDIVEILNFAFPTWVVCGESWLPWLWVRTDSQAVASEVVTLSQRKVMPIRPGILGYKAPSFVRIAVRSPSLFYELVETWSESLRVKTSEIEEPIPRLPNHLIVEPRRVCIDSVLQHEQTLNTQIELLKMYYKTTLLQRSAIPRIIVDRTTLVVLDGHHRLQFLRNCGHQTIDVNTVDYMDPSISTGSEYTKQEVIQRGLSRRLLAPKSTSHSIRSANGDEQLPAIALSLVSTPAKAVTE